MAMSRCLWEKSSRFTILFLLLSGFQVYGQESVLLKGFVVDESDSESLIGATVVSGDKHAITNADGYWLLRLKAGPTLLQCSYLGYSNKTITINLQRDTSLVISLSKNAEIAEAAVYADNPSGLVTENLGAMSMNQGLINSIPAVLGEQDVLKAIQHLPGVQGAVDGTADLLVRGGDKDENLFLMDGVPVYNTSHLFGFMSSFAPEAIKKATLYKGNFPARFGGKASSVVDIRMMDGNAFRTNGSVRIGILNDAVSVNGPIINEKLVYSAHFRGVHSAPISPILKIVRAPITYGFYDFNMKLSYKGKWDKISFTGYRGEDDFAYSGTEYEELDGEKRYIGRQDFGIKWSNTLAAFKWNHIFKNGFYSDLSLSGNHYLPQSRYGLRQEYIDATRYTVSDYRSNLTDLRFKYSFCGTKASLENFSAGIEGGYFIVAPSIVSSSISGGDSGSVPVVEDRRAMATVAVYAEGEYKVGRLAVAPGVRLSVAAVDGAVLFSPEPRLYLEYSIIDKVLLKGGYTRASQPLHCLTTSSLSMPTDLWVPVTDAIKPVTADHLSTSVTVSLPHQFELSLEGFWKYRRNIIAYRDGVSFLGTSARWDTMVSSGVARAWGLELMLRRTAGRLTGCASYSFSKSEKRFPDGQVGNGQWFPDTYDRRHIIDIWTNYRINTNITIDLLWSFAGGPRTTMADFRSIAPTEVLGYSIDFFEYERNGFQLPPSHHLDANITIQKAAKRGESVWKFGIYNIYNAKNPNLYYVEKPSYGKGNVLVLHKITILPILPSVSYEFRF